MTPTMPVYMGDIEAQIIRLSERLGDEVTAFRDLCDDAAGAEADHKLAYARSLLRLIDGRQKMTVQERDARALVENEGSYRAHLLYAARLDASKKALSACQSQLDAVRTLAANTRSLVS